MKAPRPLSLQAPVSNLFFHFTKYEWHKCLLACAHICRVPTELKKAIQQARLDKKLTQAQLGQLVNEKPNVIQEYENGKAIPAPAVLSKLSRVLGVQLSVKKK